MVGSKFVYDGVSIPYTAAEGRAAGWYADVLWTGPAVRNLQTARQDFHGMVSKPTFAEGRLIPINGEIFSSSKLTRGAVKNIVANLFVIESFPAETDEFKKLEFTDDDGTEWFIWAKVYTMPTYENERGDPIIRFFTQLYAENPLIFSKNLQSANGIYGLWGGTVLPVTLPVALSGAINSFPCVNSGNFASPAKITITGEVINPKVYNLTSGKFFKLNLTVGIGDVLIIDATQATPTATLNGVSVLGDRADGSNWIFMNAGTNDLLLAGDDFDIDDQSKAAIEVEWYNAKLV